MGDIFGFTKGGSGGRAPPPPLPGAGPASKRRRGGDGGGAALVGHVDLSSSDEDGEAQRRAGGRAPPGGGQVGGRRRDRVGSSSRGGGSGSVVGGAAATVLPKPDRDDDCFIFSESMLPGFRPPAPRSDDDDRISLSSPSSSDDEADSGGGSDAAAASAPAAAAADAAPAASAAATAAVDPWSTHPTPRIIPPPSRAPPAPLPAPAVSLRHRELGRGTGPPLWPVTSPPAGGGGPSVQRAPSLGQSAARANASLRAAADDADLAYRATLTASLLTPQRPRPRPVAATSPRTPTVGSAGHSGGSAAQAEISPAGFYGSARSRKMVAKSFGSLSGRPAPPMRQTLWSESLVTPPSTSPVRRRLRLTSNASSTISIGSPSPTPAFPPAAPLSSSYFPLGAVVKREGGGVGDAALPPPRREWRWRGRPMTSSQRATVEYLTTGRVPGEDADVTAARPPIEVRVAAARITLRRRDLRRLRGSRWLNDELMNAYVALINARNRRRVADAAAAAVEAAVASAAAAADTDDDVVCVTDAPPPPPPPPPPPLRVHVWNTFFFARLTQGPAGFDYAGVRRWPTAAGLDVSALDLLLVPVNLDASHWVLAVADLRARRFAYLDSMHGPDSSHVIPTLRRWLGAEVAARSGLDAELALGLGAWPVAVNEWAGTPIPRQRDGGSCGVFVLKTAEHLERGAGVGFGQRDVPVLRKQIVLDLQDGRVADEE